MDRLTPIWYGEVRNDTATLQARIVAGNALPRTFPLAAILGRPLAQASPQVSNATAASLFGRFALFPCVSVSTWLDRTSTASLAILARGKGAAGQAQVRCGGGHDKLRTNLNADHNPGLTQRDVGYAVWDLDAERITSKQRWPRAVGDEQFCNRVACLCVSAKCDQFRTHFQFKASTKMRCRNRSEAEHAARKTREGWTTTVKWTVPRYG